MHLSNLVFAVAAVSAAGANAQLYRGNPGAIAARADYEDLYVRDLDIHDIYARNAEAHDDLDELYARTPTPRLYDSAGLETRDAYATEDYLDEILWRREISKHSTESKLTLSADEGLELSCKAGHSWSPKEGSRCPSCESTEIKKEKEKHPNYLKSWLSGMRDRKNKQYAPWPTKQRQS